MTGDNSYFYLISENNDRERDLFKAIRTVPSIESAWQVYLLYRSLTVMPAYWHGGYYRRYFIFDESDINAIDSSRYYDMSGLSRENLLLPDVKLADDHTRADVYCTYWNEWEGLVRDHIFIEFGDDGRVSIKESDPFILFEYDCGIRL